MPLKQMVTAMSNYNLRFTIKQKVILFRVDVSIGVLVDISIGFSNLSVYICLLNTNLVLLILISLSSIEMNSLFPSLIYTYLFSTWFFFLQKLQWYDDLIQKINFNIKFISLLCLLSFNDQFNSNQMKNNNLFSCTNTHNNQREKPY
jgi:hypothetical protein